MNRRRIAPRALAHPAPRPTFRSVASSVLRIALALSIAAAVAAGLWRGAAWLRSSPTFTIQRLDLSGAVHTPGDELLRRAGIVAGAHIFSVDVAAAARAMEQAPWVRRARVSRELPDGLRITIEEHEAVALVEAGGLFAINPEGRAFKRVTASDGLDLPIVTGLTHEELAPGADRGALATALAIMAAYETSGMKDRAALSELHVGFEGSQATWSAYCGDDAIEARLGELAGEGAGGSPEQVLSRLVRVWDELGRRGAHVRSIDVGNRQRPEWVVAGLE